MENQELNQLLENFQNLQQDIEGSSLEEDSFSVTSSEIGSPLEYQAVPFVEGNQIEEEIIEMISSVFRDESPNILQIFTSMMIGLGDQTKTIAFLSGIYSGKTINKGSCGKLLSYREGAYTCKDCEMDHTCIICVECFENGNHEGHRFIYKSTSAGMCDCGDEEAWRKEGNCKNHQGFIDKEDPYLAEEHSSLIRQIFSKIIAHIAKYLDE